MELFLALYVICGLVAGGIYAGNQRRGKDTEYIMLFSLMFTGPYGLGMSIGILTRRHPDCRKE